MSRDSRAWQLAEEARAAGWTREQVIATLQARIERDDRYLARRRRQQRQTSYDEQVKVDLQALAITWLEQLPFSSTQGSEPDADLS